MNLVGLWVSLTAVTRELFTIVLRAKSLRYHSRRTATRGVTGVILMAILGAAGSEPGIPAIQLFAEYEADGAAADYKYLTRYPPSHEDYEPEFTSVALRPCLARAP